MYNTNSLLPGKFVKAAMKDFSPANNGRQILEATDYYTPARILGELEEVAGVKTKFLRLTNEQYAANLPSFMAEEMLENHLLIAEPGYYAGQSLEPSLKLLGDDRPTTWKEFVAQSGAFK